MDIEKIVNQFKEEPNHRDKWELYDLFRRWSVAAWETVIDTGQVDHSIKHSERMIGYLNEILNCYSETALIEKLSEKYITLLVIAIYTHDIGMQDFFHLTIPELRNKHLLDLDPFDLDLIREAHSHTIRKVYLELSEKILSNIPFLSQKLSDYDDTKRERLLSLIAQNSIELSILTSYHNKSLSYHELDSEIATYNKIISLDPVEKNQLICCVGLIQAADALDMSHRRIKTNFLQALNNNNNIDSEELESLEKKLNCYLIDDVKISNIEFCVTIIIVSSFSSASYEECKPYLREIIRRYKKRLDRNRFDAISMIESFLDIKITVDVKPISSSTMKPEIPAKLFDLLELKRKNPCDIEFIIKNALISSIPLGVPTYCKLYSRRMGIFFGGASCNFNAEEEQKIDQMFFYSGDWQISSKDDGGICCYEDTSELLLQQTKPLLRAYLDYIKIVAAIKSESFIPLYYKNVPIGLINCHYAKRRTKDELIKDAEEIDSIISKDLPIKLVRAHRKMSQKARTIIDSIPSLKSETKTFLINLCQYLFMDDKIEIGGVSPAKLFASIERSGIEYLIASDDSDVIKTDISATIDILEYYLSYLDQHFMYSIRIKSESVEIYSKFEIRLDASINGDVKKIYDHIEDLTRTKWHAIGGSQNQHNVNLMMKMYFEFIGGSIKHYVDEEAKNVLCFSFPKFTEKPQMWQHYHS